MVECCAGSSTVADSRNRLPGMSTTCTGDLLPAANASKRSRSEKTAIASCSGDVIAVKPPSVAQRPTKTRSGSAVSWTGVTCWLRCVVVIDKTMSACPLPTRLGQLRRCCRDQFATASTIEVSTATPAAQSSGVENSRGECDTPSFCPRTKIIAEGDKLASS